MLWFVVLTVLAFYFALFYKSQSFTEKVYEWGKTPSPVTIFFKILAKSIRRRQGQLYQTNKTEDAKPASDKDGIQHFVPSTDEVVIINGFRLTDTLVAQYNDVCGEEKGEKTEERSSKKIPVCFPECLFMYNFLLLVCKPSFKLSPLGLIHIGQTIHQHGDIQQLLDGPCSLEARTTAYRRTPRGIEADINVSVIAACGRCVWSGVATLLSRSKNTQSGKSLASPSHQQMNGDEDWCSYEGFFSHQIDAAGDTGIRYARLSGDWNPHHLYPWTARLLGYQRPIAHGLWTLAKAVALISGTTEDSCKFKQVEVRFKRPLFLPGTTTVEHYTHDNITRFRVFDSKTRAPHVVGTLS